MKIVARGARKPHEWIGRYWTCYQCKTVVLLEEGDAVHYHAAEDIRDDTYCELTCPECGVTRRFKRATTADMRRVEQAESERALVIPARIRLGATHASDRTWERQRMDPSVGDQLGGAATEDQYER